jgi:hypothetical protein
MPPYFYANLLEINEELFIFKGIFSTNAVTFNPKDACEYFGLTFNKMDGSNLVCTN